MQSSDKDESQIRNEILDGSLPPLGHIILQSTPVTKEEGEVWLSMIAQVLPSEIFTHYSWVPFAPGKTN